MLPDVLKGFKGEKLSGKQRKLNFKMIAPPPKFMQEALLQVVMVFIICNDQVSKPDCLQETTKLTSDQIQALLLVNKDSFQKVLIVVWPGTKIQGLLLLHDVSTQLHNEFIKWMKEVKTAIEVSTY